MPERRFWKNRKVLLTGHTGFKGSWLALWLHHLGADVTGVALTPDTKPHLFGLAGVERLVSHNLADIRDQQALESIVRNTRPEIVIHMAAQALVRRSYQEPLSTFATNIMGTANLLQALRDLESVRIALMVTTDKVYANTETGSAFREDAPLGGHDPYSASKAASEIVIDSYRKSFLAKQGITIASARAGNVIGGGDWSADRLLPDAVRAWQQGDVLQIRMPEAVRPWQHVLEPLSGYMDLVEALWHNPQLAGAYNFGPGPGSAIPVRRVIELARKEFGTGEVTFAPENADRHEAGLLLLDTAKLNGAIGAEPALSVEDAVARTIGWYRKQLDGEDAVQLCLDDINHYESLR